MRIHDVIDDVTMSQNKSIFKINVFSSIFQLERRSKPQNIGNTHGNTHLVGILNFQYNIRQKYLSRPEILNTFNLTSDMKRPSQIMPKSIFHGDNVIDDATGWPQSVPLYSCLGEVGSVNKLQGHYLINRCKSQSSFYVIHAKRISQWITLFKIAGQSSTSRAYWVTLALK